MWTIYKIVNTVDNKMYIGVTVNFNERVRTHLVAAYNENSFLYNNPLYYDIRNIGECYFNFEIIETGIETEDLAYELEEKYIRLYNTIIDNGKGYNLNYGGKYGKHSEYTKERLPLFPAGPENISYGKTGAEAFASKACYNLTDNKLYGSMRECAVSEYGDIKYIKQISRVCDPYSNRFTYKNKVYRKMENGVLVKKIAQPIPNKHNIKVMDKLTGRILYSLSEAAKYYDMSLGQIRDRVYGRVKDSTFSGVLIED